MAGSKINSGATNIRKTRFRSAAGLLGGASVLAFAGWGMTIGSANAAGKALGVGAKSPLSTVKFTDITGRGYAAQDIATHKASVFLFVSCQCPISNVYTPRFQALSDDYTKRGIQVFAVYSDWHESKADVVKHVRDHKITFPAIKDERNSLADRLGATSTPQAVVVGSDGTVLYRGRIDDNAVSTKVSSHDLKDALDSIVQGKPVAHPQTLAFGCAIRRDAPAAVATAGVPTYAHDVASILRAKCEGCHRPGEVAPFELQSYRQASAWSKDIKKYTQSRQMPPWKPADGYGNFADEHNINLNDGERATLARWADAGAPLGNPKQVPPPRKFASGWKLGEPDLIITPERGYHLGADGDDVYRNFVVKTNVSEDRWVRAVEVHPGNRAIVHHVINYIDANGVSDRLEGKEKDGEPGYTSFGGPGFVPTGFLGGWAPGNDPTVLPDGVGNKLPKNSRIVVQVHYHKNGKPESDRTQIGLYFCRKPVDKIAYPNLVLNFGFRIQPGETHHEAKATTTLSSDSHVLSVMPHMHLLGREMKLWATLPDGSEKPLVWIKDWDFNWQATYTLTKPLALPKGTKVHLLAYYDNSDKNPRNPNIKNPRSVTWGEQTTDEMCVAFLTYTKDDEHLVKTAPDKPKQTASNSALRSSR